MAMPGCGRPALLGMAGAGLPWGAGDGQGQPGLVVPWGTLPARQKENTPALLGQPGCGRQAWQGEKGYEILPSTDNMDTAQDAMLMREECSRTCSPQQTKPSIPPTCTKKYGEVDCFFNF